MAADFVILRKKNSSIESFIIFSTADYFNRTAKQETIM